VGVGASGSTAATTNGPWLLPRGFFRSTRPNIGGPAVSDIRKTGFLIIAV